MSYSLSPACARLKLRRLGGRYANMPSDEEVAKFMPISKPEETKRKCTRCSGTGFIAHYAHVDNGRCMSCEGRKYVYRANKCKMKAYTEAWVVAQAQAKKIKLQETAQKIKDLAGMYPNDEKTQECANSALEKLRDYWRRS